VTEHYGKIQKMVEHYGKIQRMTEQYGKMLKLTKQNPKNDLGNHKMTDHFIK
jgi:hypothetical protein